MADQLWFYARNKQKIGPVALADLRQLIVSGQLHPTDMVLPAGSIKWMQASAVDGLCQVAVAVPAPTPAPIPAQSRPPAIGPVKGFLRWLGWEVRETAVASWAQAQRLVHYGSAVWRRRQADRTVAQTELVLGEQLYQAGLGDGELRTRLAALDEQIGHLVQAKKSTRSIRSERLHLLRQLAKAVPSQPESAAVSAERVHAEKAARVAQQQQEFVREARSRLLPHGGSEWRHCIIGYSLMLTLVVGVAIWATGRRSQADPAPAQAAVDSRGPTVSPASAQAPADNKQRTSEEKNLREWIELLKDKDDLTRMEAAKAVARFGPDAKDAVPALLAILKNKDDLALIPAMEAIGAIGPLAKDASPLLVQLLKGEDKNARIVAIGTLAKLGPAARTAVPSVLALMSETDTEVASSASLAMRDLAKVNIPAVFEAYRKDKVGINQVSEWLKGIGPKDDYAIEDLAGSLKDAEPSIRSMALGGLGRIGSKAKRAVPSIRLLLDDKEDSVRRRAKEALAAIGVAGNQESVTERKPVKEADQPDSDAETERLLEAVLGKQGSAYRARGYAGLTFGEAKDKVEKVSPVIGRYRDNPWLRLKNGNEVLFSPEGELVGIATAYSTDDNKRSLEKLKDLFGAAEEMNIEQLRVVDSFTQSREDILRVSYHFPETVIVARFIYSVRVVFNSTRESERVFVAAFDRRWLVRELAADMKAKRKMLDWFAGVVKAGHSGGFDKDKLPPRADAETEEKTLLAIDGVYWTAKAMKEAPKGAPPRIEGLPNPNWFAAIGTQKIKTPEHPKGTVLCTLRFSKQTKDGDGLIRRIMTSFFADRANSVLAQEYFPPRNERITVLTKATSTAKTFEWMTKDYLMVRVQPDNTLMVIRRPD